MKTFLSWLTDLEPVRRQTLLDHRPDAVPWAHEDAELARVLSSETSVRHLAERLSLAQLQVLEALLGLGRHAKLAGLVALLAHAGDDHDEQVLTVLGELYDRGLAWSADGDAEGAV